MAKAVTIYDVAKTAGVSISTVSHTLNRPHRVQASTRERVLRAISELGYQPKPTAMELARKSTRRVGVLAPFASHDSYLRRLAGVLDEARTAGYEVVVFDQESAATSAMPLLSTLPVTRRVDGILVMGLPLDDTLAERLRAERLPTVLVDSAHPSFDSITIDDRRAGRIVVDHLLERGCRRIAYVSQSQRSVAYLSQGQLRRAGGREALVEAGLDEALLEHLVTSDDLDGGRRAVRDAMATDELPDAFFAHSDTLAAGVLAECRAQGIAVPDDIRVVGFDDSDLARALELTSVHQPLTESGRIGFRQLYDQVQRERPGTGTARRDVSLGVELVVRATS